MGGETSGPDKETNKHKEVNNEVHEKSFEEIDVGKVIVYNVSIYLATWHCF